MKLFYFAALALAAFVAIWLFVVVPAERRHHERKLEALRKRIEKRQSATSDETTNAVASDDTAAD